MSVRRLRSRHRKVDSLGEDDWLLVYFNLFEVCYATGRVRHGDMALTALLFPLFSFIVNLHAMVFWGVPYTLFYQFP